MELGVGGPCPAQRLETIPVNNAERHTDDASVCRSVDDASSVPDSSRGRGGGVQNNKVNCNNNGNRGQSQRSHHPKKHHEDILVRIGNPNPQPHVQSIRSCETLRLEETQNVRQYRPQVFQRRGGQQRDSSNYHQKRSGQDPSGVQQNRRRPHSSRDAYHQYHLPEGQQWRYQQQGHLRQGYHQNQDTRNHQSLRAWSQKVPFFFPPYGTPFFLPVPPLAFTLREQEVFQQKNSIKAIEQGDWEWHEKTYSSNRQDNILGDRGDGWRVKDFPVERNPFDEGGPLDMKKFAHLIPLDLADYLVKRLKPLMAEANAAFTALLAGSPAQIYMGVDDFDSLSVTDSGVFSDNDGCSSGRSSPISCKEGTVGGERERFAILTYDQVKRVDCVLNEMVALEGRGNFPALELKLKDLLTAVKDRLHKEGIKIRDIRLNGGAASYALKDRLDFCCVCGVPYQPSGDDGGMLCSCLSSAEGQTKNFSYNDIDLIFGMELQTVKHFDRVKTAVLDALLDLLPPQVSRKRMSPCALKEAYVSKMVKVCEGDRWSLISLGNYPSANSNNSKGRSCSVELKFVDTMRRQYEFSVDSFQIVLDSLMLFYKCANVPMSSRFYPTVVGESVFGDFYGALYHLQHGLIATRHPEEIRGGGLLKYCNLLVRGYRPADIHSIPPLQRYMCSRFFIDFPEVEQQESKLRTYLQNHMSGVSARLRYAFLITLYHVVDSSTVCLMGHERRLTLQLIQRLACELFSTDNGSQGIYGPQPSYQSYSTYYMPSCSLNGGGSTDPGPSANGTTYYNTTPQISASTSSPAVLSTTSVTPQQHLQPSHQNYQSHRSQKSSCSNMSNKSRQQPIQNSSSSSKTPSNTNNSITLPVPLVTASS